MTEPLILLDYEGETAVLTLNRPEKRNALSQAMLHEFEDALVDLERNQTKVVIVTGAGDVSFCAGADLKDTHPSRRVTYTSMIPWLRITRSIRHHTSVFIAAVNGYALGGGLTMVNNADLAIAAESATFAAPEVTFGVYAGLAGPSTVQRIAPKHAAELLLTGKRFDAETAYRWGLVNEVVPDDQLMTRARELAAYIAQWSSTALDVGRNAIRDETSMTWDQAIHHGFREGVIVSQMEKQNAEWRAGQ